MARKKRTTRDFQNSQKRLASLKSIDSQLDLGSGVSTIALETAIKEGLDALEEYNTSLSISDQKQSVVEQKIKAVNDLSDRALSGVKMKFGADSTEYEMAGGTRKSDRKRPTRKITQQKT